MLVGQFSTGFVASTTVTWLVQLALAPSLSVQVRVSVLVPSGNGPVAFNVQFGVGPSGSTEPLFTSDAETVPWQAEFAVIVASLQTATGGLLKDKSISSGPSVKPTPSSLVHSVKRSAKAANTLSAVELRSRAFAFARQSAVPGLVTSSNADAIAEASCAAV